MQPLILGVVLLVASCSVARAGELKQVDKFEGCEDFSWVQRKLGKEPAYQSQKVRYAIWVLGEGKKSVMVMAWDESEGTGKGYDTLYVDTNFNGDLTDANEKFFWKNWEKGEKRVQEHYFIENIKEADGKGVFHLRFESHGTNDSLGYSTMLTAEGKYGIHLHHPINWSNVLETAPIYTLGRGPLVPLINGKVAGESLGTFTAGAMASAGWRCVAIGDKLENQLHAGYTGGQTLLRVCDEKGQLKEDLPFTGGCG